MYSKLFQIWEVLVSKKDKATHGCVAHKKMEKKFNILQILGFQFSY